MKSSLTVILLFILLFLSTVLVAQQQYANLGDFRLDNGQILHDCRVGYRTFGKLNDQQSNAVLFPTWFGGKSRHLASLCASDRFVDSTKFCIIAVDAFGNGVSASPSNNGELVSESFPKFVIRDMVHAQYQLLTRVLNIHHLYGIIGGSMGGMQVFEWLVSYPQFMDKAVAYIGSPKLTSYDLLLWQAELLAIEMGRRYQCDEKSIMELVATINSLASQTPQYRVQHTTTEEFGSFLESHYSKFSQNFNADDWASQLRAIMAHDSTVPYNGSLPKAAAVVQADVLIITSSQDHMVNPAPALEFARLINAEVFQLNSDCGHLAVSCELDKVSEVISQFWIK